VVFLEIKRVKWTRESEGSVRTQWTPRQTLQRVGDYPETWSTSSYLRYNTFTAVIVSSFNMSGL